MRRLSLALVRVSLVVFPKAARAGAQTRVERNVVYGIGTHSGDFGTSGKPHPNFPNVLSEAVGWLTQYLSGNR